MPTDISTPVWQCDICRARFGADRAAAQRCEAAGPPEYLPDGELCLHYRESPGGGGYQLVVLHPVAAIGTTATTYNGNAGHIARYEADGDRYEGRNRTWDSTSLWPAQPGRLNTHVVSHVSGLAGWSRGHTGTPGTDGLWAFALAGLPISEQSARDAGRGVASPVLARPVTPVVRAALTMLGAFPERPRAWDYHGLCDGESVAAAEETSQRDGLPAETYDPARLRCWLAQSDLAVLRREIHDRQRAWRDGAPDSVPMPRMQAARAGRLTASKLTKAQRAVVDATGVPWPARTTASEYADLLIRKTLGAPMTATTEEPGSPRLFSTVRHRVAVTSSKGGVGKTTVAAAVGAGLAAAGRHVLVVDMNLANPGQHIIWRLGPAEVDTAAKLVRGQRVPCPPGQGGSLRVFSHGQLAPDTAGAVISVDRAGEWLAFLAGALDLRGLDVVLFDLPPGWDNAHRQVFDRHQTGLTAVVHVTTGHPLAAETELVHGNGMPQQDKTPRWLVENLSRARGPVIGDPGTVAEVRLYGTTDQPVRDLAARLRMTYAGSLPWEPAPLALAVTAEVTALAASLLSTDGRAPEADHAAAL